MSGSAWGQNDVYYSVGTNPGDLKTGAPTITIAGGTATLSVPQTGAGNVGVGDEIDYGKNRPLRRPGDADPVAYRGRRALLPSRVSPGLTEHPGVSAGQTSLLIHNLSRLVSVS